MKKTSILLVIAGMLMVPSIGSTNDLETVTIVRYVQECVALKKEEGRMNIYEATYKCSCVIDKLAEVFTQTEFDEANVGFQLQNIPGDRGAEFRDDEPVQEGIRLFKQTHIEAYASCRMR